MNQTLKEIFHICKYIEISFQLQLNFAKNCNDLSLKFVILLGEIFRCAEEKLLKACGGRTAHK